MSELEHFCEVTKKEYDEWCPDCKEYDKERNSCPRWNRVIKETLKDLQEERKMQLSEENTTSDYISRQAAIDIEPERPLGREVYQAGYAEGYKAGQEERKTGKWIWKTLDVYKCSECETETHVDECMEEPIYNFCPYCGARLVQEGEEP